ncbi:hypothetical protein MMC22_002738 [Lobaria immixta]|nr:hypothetical protein [Lobaria immixta]
MADSALKDVAAKQRIITHMNNDHQDSLIRYLEYFCHLSSSSARHAQLTDISLDGLTIRANGASTYRVPIKPSMTSWADARPRVVAMDAEAVAGLNRSNITVKTYARPNGITAVLLALILSAFLVFSKRSNFQPGSFLHDVILIYAPGFARFCFRVQPLILYSMVSIHLGEGIYMVRGRLQKHTVPRFSKLWWKWALNSFIEGYGSFVRFDEIVKEEELKRESRKH